MCQDYVYIDHNGSLLDQNDQPDQQAALQHARVLGAHYQARFVCVARVIRLKLEIPRCDCCGQRFDGYGEICAACGGEMAEQTPRPLEEAA